METINIETTKEQLLIDRLRKDLRLFTENESHKISFWSEKEIELKTLLETSDPAAFCTWEVIKNTMYFNPHLKEYEYLRQSNQWPLLNDILNEEKIGNARGYFLHPSASGNLIHHLYSYLLFCDHTGIHPGKLSSVLEFGGGYGSFCRLLYKMGFHSRYHIFDLPVLTCLQRYFLAHTNPGLPVNYNSLDGQQESVSLINDISYLQNDKSKWQNVDLFIGLWSISEAPFALRDFFFDNLSNCRYILVGYQKDFEGLDNARYFSELEKRMDRYQWVHQEIPHMDDNFYLIGSAKW